MQLGLHLSTQMPPDTETNATFEALMGQIRRVEAAGFRSILVPQHYLTDYNQFQPLPVLARATVEAPELRFGTGIILLPLHHPIEIAENVATLSAMSKYPIIVGIGTGYRDIEFESFGVSKGERGKRLAEGIEIMRRLWEEEDVTYDGSFFQIDGVTINPRPTTPPAIWVGANTRPAIERAARMGDAWYINPHSTIEEIQGLKAEYDETRSALGKELTVPMRREVFTSGNPETLKAVKRALAAKYDRYIQWGQHKAMEDESDLQQEFESLASDRFILGEPESVAAELERYETELNVSEVIVRVHFPGIPIEATYECIDLLGDEVIPSI